MNKQFAKSCTPYYIIKPKLLRVVSKALKPGDLALAHFCHLPRIFLQSCCAFHGSRNAPNFKAFAYLQRFARATSQVWCFLVKHPSWLPEPPLAGRLPNPSPRYLARLAPEMLPQPSPRHSIDR